MRPRFLYVVFIGILLLSMLSEDSRGQTSGNFAYLVMLQQPCDPSETGCVEFALNGDPNNYTYYWTHGPTTLAICNLPEGLYTLVVIDLYGCVETYTIEIVRLYECTMEYELRPTPNPCIWMIVITVEDGNGTPIPESALNIEWADGDPSGLTRFVTRDHTEEYCVSINALPNGEPGSQSCCEMEECILVEALLKCTIMNRREIIVNELNRSETSGEQFVELLIIGNGTCEDSFDLRGFIVDDNNGYLIPGNDFLNSNNTSTIGIEPGYLVFSEDSSWMAVPTGSLIVIHSGQNFDGGVIPPDDPFDANQDKVYVLPANHQQLFWARSGTWNAVDKTYVYSGYVIPPSWDIVRPSAYSDGMQVR